MQIAGILAAVAVIVALAAVGVSVSVALRASRRDRDVNESIRQMRRALYAGEHTVRKEIAELADTVRETADTLAPLRSGESGPPPTEETVPDATAREAARVPEGLAETESVGPADPALLSEFVHMLRTPLATLLTEADNTRVELDRVRDVLPTESRDRILRKIDRLAGRASACEATLAVFQDVLERRSEVRSRQFGSLPEAVANLHMVVDQNRGIATELKAELPSQVRGVATDQIVVILIPLLENAVEACKDGDTITVSLTESEGSVELSVANPDTTPVDERTVLTPGRTTKHGHQGLGVPSARTVAAVTGGTLAVERGQGAFVVRVHLPRR